MGYEANTSERGREAVLARWKPILEKELLNLSLNTSDDMIIKKASIIACLIADGTVARRISKNGTHFEIYFYPDDVQLLKKFLFNYKTVYNRNLPFKKMRGYYRVYTKHKIAVLDLLQYTNFSGLAWTLPVKLLSSKKSKAEFLRAYFDCEGYVNNRVVRVESVNNIGLTEIQKMLLEDFGIESKMYHYRRKQKLWNVNHILSIHKNSERIKFLKEIGFDHSRKKKLLIASVAELG